MKPARTNYSVILILTAAFAFSYSAFAGVPAPQKGASSDELAKETCRLDTTKESKTVCREPVDATAKETTTSAVSLFGFLPADILTPRVETSEIGVQYSSPIVVRYSSPSVSPRAYNTQSSKGDYDAARLAKEVLNPVSSLARISFESNIDFGLAANREGYRYIMNLDPVIPFAIGKDWNLISRTRIQSIQQDGINRSTVQGGLGDMLQSFFLSPRSTEGYFWGAGAALLIPTANDPLLGSGKFGLGPTVAAGKQGGGAWTYGALARHISSVVGHSARPDVESTYIQPFAAYTTRSGWTLAVDTESTYDWIGKQWSVPIHLELTKVVGFRRHPVRVGGALACWAATTSGGPQACGARFTVTPLFPAR